MSPFYPISVCRQKSTQKTPYQTTMTITTNLTVFIPFQEQATPSIFSFHNASIIRKMSHLQGYILCTNVLFLFARLQPVILTTFPPVGSTQMNVQYLYEKQQFHYSNLLIMLFFIHNFPDHQVYLHHNLSYPTTSDNNVLTDNNKHNNSRVTHHNSQMIHQQ